MVTKASVRAKISSVNAELSSLTTEISRLKTAKQKLQAVDTSIEYVLKSHSHIKHTYFLAGTPYLNETEMEEENLKNVSHRFEDEKVSITIELQSKINKLEAEAFSLREQLKWLELDLRYAEGL